MKSAVAATCEDNLQLIEWVHSQPLAATVTCLGDGHDGIWNLIQPMVLDGQRREVRGLVSFDGEPRASLAGHSNGSTRHKPCFGKAKWMKRKRYLLSVNVKLVPQLLPVSGQASSPHHQL